MRAHILMLLDILKIIIINYIKLRIKNIKNTKSDTDIYQKYFLWS